jgi:hypothetical protein
MLKGPPCAPHQEHSPVGSGIGRVLGEAAGLPLTKDI